MNHCTLTLEFLIFAIFLSLETGAPATECLSVGLEFAWLCLRTVCMCVHMARLLHQPRLPSEQASDTLATRSIVT